MEREPAELATLLLRKAHEDAAALRELTPNTEIADSIVGFHAQQAVEKWLKAVVASRGEAFEHTHDLRHLIALAESDTSKFPFDTKQVIALTEYAVPLRYEDLLDAEPLDREPVVELVKEVGRWAIAEIEPTIKGGNE